MIKQAYLGSHKYIFVSYAHKDKDIAYPFIEELQKHFNVWYDDGIKYDSEWADDIIKHLKECEVFIYLVSSNSLNSENCKDEIHSARELHKNFINVIIDDNVELNDTFKFRYGRFQMFTLSKFKTYNDAIIDLKKKCSWLSNVTKTDDESAKDKSVSKTNTVREPEPQKAIKDIKNAIVGDVVTFGHYPQDSAKNPLEWIVLTKDNKDLLLLSKYVIDCCQYRTTMHGGVGYYKDSLWIFSELREWSNDKFLEMAFSKEEFDRIYRSDVPHNDYYGHCSDWIYLLDKDGIESFLPLEEQRIAQPTKYAIRQGCKEKNNATNYWIANYDYEAGSRTSFYVNEKGDIKKLKQTKKIGFRPVMWVKS